MKALFLSVLAVPALAVPAMAGPAPLLGPAPGVPVNWQGFYAGATVGAAWSRLSFDPNVLGYGRQSDTDAGIVFGGYAGYNMMLSGNWLLGAETDLTRQGAGNSITYDSETRAAGDSYTQASLRARLGYAVDRTLFYGTAGLAVGNPRADWSQDYFGAEATEHGWKTGFIAGGGVEYMLAPNTLLRVEGLYTNYGSHNTYDDYFDADMKAKYSNVSVRAGIAYKF